MPRAASDARAPRADDQAGRCDRERGLDVAAPVTRPHVEAAEREAALHDELERGERARADPARRHRWADVLSDESTISQHAPVSSSVTATSSAHGM